MESKLTPEEEELLYQTFGCSPERKKARQKKQKKEPEAGSIAAQVQQIFGKPRSL